MADYRTDLSRSIADTGLPDSPQGALKKAGALGANPAAVEPMFNGSAIMDALGYNNPNGKIDIGVAGGAPGNRPQPIAGNDSALAAIKAKDAAITGMPTQINPNAGITAAMVQRPTTQPVQPVVPAIADTTRQNAFSGSSPVIALNGKTLGDTSAISNRVDWSPGSKNAQAIEGIAGMNIKPTSLTSYGTQAQTDEFGRPLPDKVNVQNLGTLSNRGDMGLTYDQQVAKANAINANTMQQLGNISPKQQFDMTFVGKADASNPSYRNAMLTRENWAKNNANNQAELGRQNQLTIADTNADAHKYAADQGLAGHKYTADASVKSHQITADASVKAHEIAGQQKGAEKQKTDLTGRIKDLTKQYEGLNLAGADKGMAAEYAKNQVMVEANPDKLFSVYGRAGRNGMALPITYKPLYASYLDQARKSYPNESQAQEIATSWLVGKFNQDNQALVAANKPQMPSLALLNTAGVTPLSKTQPEPLQ